MNKVIEIAGKREKQRMAEFECRGAMAAEISILTTEYPDILSSLVVIAQQLVDQMKSPNKEVNKICTEINSHQMQNNKS